MPGFHYKAFISYSWADAKWGVWLHHALETYRPPKGLVLFDGSTPSRLRPIFRDREEEAAGTGISAAIEQALGSSDFLIVVCSPNSAKSEWVNREVAWFKTHRTPDNVLALIVDGEPGHADDDCFPPSLTHEVTDDLAVRERLPDLPLAADARKFGDGKRKALLKLVAAMLGVRLDDLVRRDQRRQALRTRMAMAVSSAIILAVGVSSWSAISARYEMQRQRSEAAELIEYMLTDLKSELVSQGQLSQIDKLGERALEYYRDQDLASLDADSLGRRARALHVIGETRLQRGDTGSALEIFQEAAATTGRLLEFDPENAQRIFEHAQSVFWVGAVAYDHGNLDAANSSWDSYLRLSKQLVAIDPQNIDWQRELAWAHGNVGAILEKMGRIPEAERASSESRSRFEAIVQNRANPESQTDRLELSNAATQLAYDLILSGKFDAAEHRVDEAIAILEQILSEDSGHFRAKSMLETNLKRLAEIGLARGKLSTAIREAKRSILLSDELTTNDPENKDWRLRSLETHRTLAEALMFSGSEDARSMHTELVTGLRQLVESDPANIRWQVQLAHAELLPSLRKDWTPNMTIDDVEALSERLKRILATSPNYAAVRLHLAWSYFAEGQLLAQIDQNEKAIEKWQDSIDLASSLPVGDLKMLAIKALALSKLGKSKEADEIVQQLRSVGFNHPMLRLVNA